MHYKYNILCISDFISESSKISLLGDNYTKIIWSNYINKIFSALEILSN